MKSLFKTLVAGMAFFSFSSAFAQSGLSTKVLTFPLLSSVNAVDTVAVRIYNLDTAAYTGYINTYYSTDTVTFSPLPLCSIANATLAGLDSVDLQCTITFDSTYFDPGNNIVVVWSSGSAKAAADSTWLTVNLTPYIAGIHESGSSLFSLYPSLAGNYIMLESATTLMPEKIFISDLSGRIVSVPATTTDARNRMRIHTAGLNNGVYFLNAILPDKSRYVAKFVKVE
jgi:hypothetical protein